MEVVCGKTVKKAGFIFLTTLISCKHISLEFMIDHVTFQDREVIRGDTSQILTQRSKWRPALFSRETTAKKFQSF